MAKNYLILTFCLISVITNAQKFETYYIVAPTMSFGVTDLEKALFSSSGDYNDYKVAFGISGAIQEFYNITPRIAIGSELNYSNSNYKILPMIVGADDGTGYECNINIQSLNIPLILRCQIEKKWMFQVGYGFAYVMDSKIKVYNYYRPYTYNPVVRRRQIQDKSFDINGEFNSYYTFAFGKFFNIKHRTAMLQLYFEQSLNEYYFSHSWSDPSDGNMIEYTFKPHMIGLRLGMKL